MNLLLEDLPSEQETTSVLPRYPMKESLRYWIRHVLGAFHVVQRPLKRPIIIFSSRRSGSTLLREVIGSEKGMNVSDQPLDLWHYNPYRRHMPQPYLSKFIDLSPEEETQLYDYLRKLLTCRIRVRSRWNMLDPDYSFVVNRLVAKVLNAKFLIDWVAKHFDVDIVYQVRHPIPYALSVVRLGWGCTAEAFLQSPVFSQNHLDEGRIRQCRYILEHGTDLQKHVLEWGLENLYPLSVFKERPWLTLTYEEFVSRPLQSCQLLAERLDLSDPEHMSQHVARPSGTTTQDSKSDITTHGPTHLLRRWMDHVDSTEARDAMMILGDILNIRVYMGDSPFPAETLCCFGPLS